MEYHLVIEVDGSQHMVQAPRDACRDEYLRQLGFRVLRFWDNDVLNNTIAVMEAILQALEQETRPPS